MRTETYSAPTFETITTTATTIGITCAMAEERRIVAGTDGKRQEKHKRGI